MSAWQVGVFTSVDAGLGVHLDVVEELKIPTIQIHAPHPGSRTQSTADEYKEKLAAIGVEVTAVFGGFEGESYASIPTTADTVGLVPQATRASRVQEMKDISDFAKMLGCDVVALHIGFVPHDRDGADYKDIIAVTRDLLDHIKANGQSLNLETGQESANHLLQFITDVERDNLFINFDPANMILYGTGDPIDALKKVGHLVKSVHCKDATWNQGTVQGEAWGCEVPFGEGHVYAETYLRTLHEIGYDGPLTIEREIPEDREQQKADIGKAVALLEELRTKILG